MTSDIDWLFKIQEPDVPCVVCHAPQTEKVGKLEYIVGGFAAWIHRKCSLCGYVFKPEETEEE